MPEQWGPEELEVHLKRLRRSLFLIIPTFALWMVGVALGDYTTGAVHYFGNALALIFGFTTLWLVWMWYRYWRGMRAVRRLRDD